MYEETVSQPAESVPFDTSILLDGETSGAASNSLGETGSLTVVEPQYSNWMEVPFSDYTVEQGLLACLVFFALAAAVAKIFKGVF